MVRRKLLTIIQLRRQDSNMRPPGYEPGELPTAPLRDVTINNRIGVTKISIAGAKVRLLVETTKLRNEIMKDLTVI